MSFWFVFTASHIQSGSASQTTIMYDCEVTSPPVLYGGSVFGTRNNPASGVYFYQYGYSQSSIGRSGGYYRRWGATIGSQYKNYYSAYSGYNGSTNYYSYVRNYVGNLIRSNNEIKNSLILANGVKLNATTISGKYRPKANTMIGAIRYGGVDIPVSYSFDGNAFDHMIFPSWTSGYQGWNYQSSTYSGSSAMSMTNNKYSFAGYKESEFADDDSILTWFTSSYNSQSLSNDYIGKILDFGSVPQEVPEFFKAWIDANFDVIYDETYIIYDPSLNILAQLDDAPPIKLVTLIHVGNNATLSMTGINDVDYTLTWSVTVPQGKRFAGLKTPLGTLIGLGTTEVSWSSLALMEYFEVWNPPETTFDINLYENTAEPNRVDKTSFLTSVGTLSGALREECSVINPSIVIYYDHVPDFNYVYIQTFGRFYFVRGITSVRKNLWRIDLDCDVLMTYKSGILALSAVIGRQEFDYNADLVDADLPVEKEVSVTVDEISSTAFSTEATGTNVYNYVLTVIGS